MAKTNCYKRSHVEVIRKWFCSCLNVVVGYHFEAKTVIHQITSTSCAVVVALQQTHRAFFVFQLIHLVNIDVFSYVVMSESEHQLLGSRLLVPKSPQKCVRRKTTNHDLRIIRFFFQIFGNQQHPCMTRVCAIIQVIVGALKYWPSIYYEKLLAKIRLIHQNSANAKRQKGLQKGLPFLHFLCCV